MSNYFQNVLIAESLRTLSMKGDKWVADRIVNGEKLTDCTKVKLIRYGVVR